MQGRLFRVKEVLVRLEQRVALRGGLCGWAEVGGAKTLKMPNPEKPETPE